MQIEISSKTIEYAQLAETARHVWSRYSSAAIRRGLEPTVRDVLRAACQHARQKLDDARADLIGALAFDLRVAGLELTSPLQRRDGGKESGR